MNPSPVLMIMMFSMTFEPPVEARLLLLGLVRSMVSLLASGFSGSGWSSWQEVKKDGTIKTVAVPAAMFLINSLLFIGKVFRYYKWAAISLTLLYLNSHLILLPGKNYDLAFLVDSLKGT